MVASTEIQDGVLETIGNTPMIKLSRMFPSDDFSFFAKLESANPGGSMKDRPALRMVKDGLAKGTISKGSTLVESSSGNLAIGLAQVSCALGLKLIVVVDPKVTQANLRILRAYGAEIDMVSIPDPETGEYLAARRKRVSHLVQTLPNAFNLNQYANPGNPASHREGTYAEIFDALDNRLDWLLICISTCGGLRGARELIRQRGMKTKILAIDAAGSVIFGSRGPRLLPGHGAGIIPEHMADDLADESQLVSDAECVAGCRALVQKEALLAGASSGGIVSVVSRLQGKWRSGERIAAVLPDRGERYMDTVYDDAWCERNFGHVPKLVLPN
jgi:2,3-diaminopropionate biosynthesis protein SbnA